MGGTTVTFKSATVTAGVGYAFGGRAERSGERPGTSDQAIHRFASMYFGNLAYSYSSFVGVIGFTF